MGKVISMYNVHKSYGKHEVLKGINLRIEKGEIYGLVGKNGAGKTTIFKILLGLSPINMGEISINDSLNNQELLLSRKKIGFYISPCFYDYMTARENLEYYRTLKGIKDKNEVERVLKIVGLEEVKTKYKSFSLGMKQRLGIANAIMGSPEILILDEPANGLDPQGIVDVRNLIKSLNKDYGMTILVSSHILSELENTATRFGIVDNGVIVSEATDTTLKDTNTDTLITIDTKDLETVKQLLEENHIEIKETKKVSTSLEDFYFDSLEGE